MSEWALAFDTQQKATENNKKKTITQHKLNEVFLLQRYQVL